jgi:predicted PurR-regulated permease PerM
MAQPLTRASLGAALPIEPGARAVIGASRADSSVAEPDPGTESSPLPLRTRLAPLRWLIVTLCLGALMVFVPLWVPLILAAWVAIIAHPLHTRLSRKLGGSHRAAGAMTVSFVLIGLVPLVGLTAALTGRAIELTRQILGSEDGAAALRTVVSSSGNGPAHPASLQAFDVQKLVDMAQQHGANAWRALRAIAGAATALVVGLLIFILGIYEFLVHGTRIYQWLVDHAPIPRGYVHRLGNAFSETGRGLFIGVGLTAFLQGALATIGYVAVGIREAFVLGALTVVASVIPAGGAALVWAPVSIALAIGGRPVAAVVMLVIGLIVSTADNVVRPMLSRYGKLRMPTFLLLISMLGGLAVFGGWGVLLGPLLVRLAVEGLEIWRERAVA